MAVSTKSGFTADERAAMKERARELKSAATKDEAAKEVLDKIATLEGTDRIIAERLHAIITENVPELYPKTYYGMVGFARDGKVVCFLQDAKKFGTRYCTFGFQDTAAIDDGVFWPTSYAITELTPATEQAILALVKKAVS